MLAERMIVVKRWIVSLITVGCLLIPSYTDAAVTVPMNIYQWVQSTARSTYYFNRQSMSYGLDQKGFLDLNILLVPAIKTYDSVQKNDIISKRRWRNLPVENYDYLSAGAYYLSFNLSEKTVHITKRVDLDQNWGALGTDTSGKPMKLNIFSEKDVEGIFYRSILKYAAEHQEDIIKQTNGKLLDEDKSKLEDAKIAIISAAEIPPKKEKLKEQSQLKEQAQQKEQPKLKEQAQQKEQPKQEDQAQQKEQPKQEDQAQQKEQPKQEEQAQQKEQPQQKEQSKQSEQNQTSQQPQPCPCCQHCPYCQQFINTEK